VLLRLAYLGVTNVLAMLRPLPMSDRTKDAELVVWSPENLPAAIDAYLASLPAGAAPNWFLPRTTRPEIRLSRYGCGSSWADVGLFVG